MSAAANSARAHPESVSNLTLSLGPTNLHAVMTLPTRDLTRWFPPGRYQNYVADVLRELQGQADTLLEVRWDDAVGHLSRANIHRGLTGFIIAELDYPLVGDAAVLQVRVSSIGNLPNDHQEITSIEDDRGGAGGRMLAEETLTAQQDTLSVDLPTVEASNPSAAAAEPAVTAPAVTAPADIAPVVRSAVRLETRRPSKLLPWIACFVPAAAVGAFWALQRIKTGRRTE